MFKTNFFLKNMASNKLITSRKNTNEKQQDKVCVKFINRNLIGISTILSAVNINIIIQTTNVIRVKCRVVGSYDHTCRFCIGLFLLCFSSAFSVSSIFAHDSIKKRVGLVFSVFVMVPLFHLSTFNSINSLLILYTNRVTSYDPRVYDLSPAYQSYLKSRP